MPINLTNEPTPTKAYSPTGTEYDIQQYLQARIPILKDSKKKILGNIDFEEIMREADREYQPEFLSSKNKGTRSSAVIIDESKGLRSATSTIHDTSEDEWLSNVSEPTLLVKIQTALSILVDRNPIAILKAAQERYKKSTAFYKAIYNRGWKLGKAKRQLKLFIFDLAKYGWAVARTYPRLVKVEGEILESLDRENPEKSKYRKTSIVRYNGVMREKLDPYRTWIDDMANLTDEFSLHDWYFEKDYSKDSFKTEFKQYVNVDTVEYGGRYTEAEHEANDDVNEETKNRDDIVTVGFYESDSKDLYCIFIPKQNIVLYYSPLPNDSKRLSLWQTYWNERGPRTPYGIGLYEILKHNKILYDRFDNMTVDQLTMAIYPMLFYSGTGASGDIRLSPNIIKQKLPGTTVEQVQVKYDPRGFEAIQFRQERMDENSGITPTLMGKSDAATLGQSVQERQAGLQRLSTPLGNIAEVLEDDAYIALSWERQILSTPEVKEFYSDEEIAKYQEESGNILQNPQQMNVDPATGIPEKVTGEVYQNLDLTLTEDRHGNLIESPEDRFFTIGADIPLGMLKWEGQITIEPQSIIAPSVELDRQRKLELFNLVMPIVTQMTMVMYQHVDPKTQQVFTPEGSISVAIGLYKPLKQVLEAQEEKPENWIPDDILKAVENPEAAMQAQQMKEQQAMMAQQQQANASAPLFVNPNDPNSTSTPTAGGMSRMGGNGITPMSPNKMAESIVSRDQVSNPARNSIQGRNVIKNKL